jgi:hypothetical protein
MAFFKAMIQIDHWGPNSSTVQQAPTTPYPSGGCANSGRRGEWIALNRSLLDQAIGGKAASESWQMMRGAASLTSWLMRLERWLAEQSNHVENTVVNEKDSAMS